MAQDTFWLQSVEEIEEQEIEWLIPHWVPKGGITLLVGDGGVGKTNLWSFLVSRIRAGLPTLLDLPDLEKDSPSPGPGVVAKADLENGVLVELKNTACLYFSKEDSTAKRLRKNFTLYEANMREIHTVEIDRLVGFDYTSAELEAMIESLRPAIVVFDPIQTFFPTGASMTSRQQTRKTLDRLVQLGQKYDTAYLLVCHTNKKKTDDWSQKINGSADLPDIARSVIFTLYTELAPGRQIHYISNEKNSYAKPEGTVLYRIDAEGRITYADVSDRKFADYAVQEPWSSRSKPVTLKDACKQQILLLLNERETKEMPISDLDEALQNFGFSVKICTTAKAELDAEEKVEREHVKLEKGAQWRIRIPRRESGMLKKGKMGSEYKTITRDGKRKPAHVVLMEEYLGRPLRDNEVVHHINGEKDDNRLENLQVMDRAEHTRLHAAGVTPNAETLEKLSRSHKGKPSANRKLAKEQVCRIAEMLKAGVSATKIAEEFPVSVPSIVSIRDGKSYRDFLEGFADSEFPLQEKKRGRANRTERKLDPKELGFVRIALMEGESVPVIAKRFGISPSSVRAIRDGLTYREIPWPQEEARLFLTHDMPAVIRILLEEPMSEKEEYHALTEDYHLVPNVGTVLALKMVRKAMEGERDLALLLLLTAGYGDWVQQLIRDESVLWQTIFLENSQIYH